MIGWISKHSKRVCFGRQKKFQQKTKRIFFKKKFFWLFFFSISRISITSKSGSIGSLTSSSKRRNRVEFSGSENSIFNLMTSAFVTIRPAVWSFAALSLLYYIIAGRFPQKYPTSSDLLLSSQQLLLDVRNGTENKTKQDVKIETKTNCSFHSTAYTLPEAIFLSSPLRFFLLLLFQIDPADG